MNRDHTFSDQQVHLDAAAAPLFLMALSMHCLICLVVDRVWPCSAFQTCGTDATPGRAAAGGGGAEQMRTYCPFSPRFHPLYSSFGWWCDLHTATKCMPY